MKMSEVFCCVIKCLKGPNDIKFVKPSCMEKKLCLKYRKLSQVNVCCAVKTLFMLYNYYQTLREISPV